MQIHLHEVKILQIHNARPEFVKYITAINQSESSIFIQGVINVKKLIIMLMQFKFGHIMA
jgi:hypothetical protein